MFVVQLLFIGYLQELGRFNSLLSVMRSTLLALDQACKGLALMSAELDALGRSLFDGKVSMVKRRYTNSHLAVVHGHHHHHQQQQQQRCCVFPASAGRSSQTDPAQQAALHALVRS
jgi:hypothetical protein